MINNRQNGRRRGRGGGAPRPNGGGGPDRGNRIDNRARGNAAQLHEKYKALARDAQMQGDRVMTEYYLQFADHYFRVLSENRARFEDQQPRQRRDEWQQQGDYQDEFEDGIGDERSDFRSDARNDNRDDREERGGEQQQRYTREPREQRNGRYEERRPRQREQYGDRQERFEEPQAPVAAAPAPAPVEELVPSAEEAPAPRRRGRRPAAAAAQEPAEAANDRLAADRLPPAFAAELPLGVEAAPVEEAKPRRRGRKPKSDSVAAGV